MKSIYKITIIVLTIFLICLLLLLNLDKLNLKYNNIDFGNWASLFITLASILVAILIIVNFTTVISAYQISKRSEENIIEIPKLRREINILRERIEDIENESKLETIEKLLRALKSENMIDHHRAALELSEMGDKTCLQALYSSLENKDETSNNREIIKYAIGRIEERDKKILK